MTTAARTTTRLNISLQLPVLPPVGALRGHGVRLFLTSATLLFVELLLIRWIPANVTYIGFFTNFLLMASFLGIGLGILLGRDADARRSRSSRCCSSRSSSSISSAQLNVQVTAPTTSCSSGSPRATRPT